MREEDEEVAFRHASKIVSFLRAPPMAGISFGLVSKFSDDDWPGFQAKRNGFINNGGILSPDNSKIHARP
jgi:hypothetical protein